MFYIFCHIDCPDGQSVDLIPYYGNNVQEVIDNWEKQRLKDAEDYAGKDDFQGQLDYFEKSEENYKRLCIIDIVSIKEVDYNIFKRKMIEILRNKISSQKEELEKQEYERLKKKFGAL